MTVILRDYGHTKRAHCVKTVHTQSVAEHSHGVALFCAQLCGGQPSAALLLAALYHDLPECVTGDVPATAKWHNEKLADALELAENEFMDDNNLQIALSSDEQLILKLADLLDLGFYCIDELMYGNRHVESMYHNVAAALVRMNVRKKELPISVKHKFSLIYEQLEKRYAATQFVKPAVSTYGG